ncbi:hemerythrin domain-containing protein [Flavisolibacter nicotianae]|uniref:hemerythrin domain-containing protein n=1 Tax=Flavisolibacter nicotianae TaxID=2364882 RepID=UPI000EB3781E|nr:hemerythrin domain-containing protein [Flavisolibacter nicotianae]
MDQPKPIKRSKELVPLSKDHHEGLLFAWKIKQGLRKGTDHRLIADFIRWFWKAELQEHFRKEEEVLAPHLQENDALVAQMIDEHQELEALVRLCEMVADEDIFLQLANGLDKHIRFEERTFFPHAEKLIPPVAMESIYTELVKTRPHTAWENQFWLADK